MKYNEVVVEGRYWWQPERDSVTGALPPKQKVTVVRKTGIKTGIAPGGAQDYDPPTDPLQSGATEDRHIEIKTEGGEKKSVKAKELSPLEDRAEQ
jgi:hypothetical protein